MSDIFNYRVKASTETKRKKENTIKMMKVKAVLEIEVVNSYATENVANILHRKKESIIKASLKGEMDRNL